MDSLLGLLPMLFLVAVMVWMIVSQRRRQQEVSRMQSSLTAGDEVLTVGGIIGRVTSVDGPVIGLEVSPGVVLRIDRRTVSGRTSDVPVFSGRDAAQTQVVRAHDSVRTEVVRPHGDDTPGQV